MLGKDPHVRTIGQDWWPIIIVIIVHRNTPTNFKRQDLTFSKSPHAECRKKTHCPLFPSHQEADEYRFCRHEPVPQAANPEPPVLPPGESPSWADRAGGDQTDLPQGERVESGQAELRQRWWGGQLMVKLVVFPSLEAGQGVLLSQGVWAINFLSVWSEIA